MKEQIVKIHLAAEELGVSVKTIYNWIEWGKLKMARPGYVNQIDAWETYLQQKQDKSIYSSLMAKYGITRDSNGRFITKSDRGEQSGGKW